MATRTVTAACTRSVISRQRKDGAGLTGIGADLHLTVGAVGGGSTAYRHRSFLVFDIAKAVAGAKKVIKAEIVLRTDMKDSAHFYGGAYPHIETRQIATGSMTEGSSANPAQGEGKWNSDNYRWPDVSGIIESYTVLPATDNTTVYLDVTKNIRNYLPASVLGPDGQPGLGHVNRGWALLTEDEWNVHQRACFVSRHHGTTTARPYLLLTLDETIVDAKGPPAAPVSLSPSGEIHGDMEFEGYHSDPTFGLVMEGKDIAVYQGGTLVWSLDASDQTASGGESANGRFSVPLTRVIGLLRSQTDYEWCARTRSVGGWGPWSDRVPIRITSRAPSVVAESLGTVETVTGLHFGGAYSDPDGDPMASYRIQLRPYAPQGDPIWVDELPLWDTGTAVPTISEIQGNRIGREYGGRTLYPGRFSFRVRATDQTGTESDWSYAEITIKAVEYPPEEQPPLVPDPGDYEYATLPDRDAPVRIALYKMGPKRGPGALLGYINDPVNLGASAVVNGGGELYFTLPALHPLCPDIEPHDVHYAVQQWWGDHYRVMFAGLITDFDATPDEVVYYGTDYLGLFQTSVDERFDPKAIETPAPTGSKYVDKRIDQIIIDQLDYHRGLENSQVGFIRRGYVSQMQEKATIYSTYTEALPFMVGLLDSHKQGTGVECRMFVRPRGFNDYEITVVDNWGKDRPNIRLQYGGLLNDFRIVALGDFGTRILAVGQKRGQTQVWRATGQAMKDDGTPWMNEQRWGRIAKTRFYPDLIDEADLQRRAREAAAELGKVGKRMALAIRVDGLTCFDGWDLGDFIKVDILRGVADTFRYGSEGYWKVLGVEFRYYPDGHYDTTLTIMPKKTQSSADPDLIPSQGGGVSKEWQIGRGVARIFNAKPDLGYAAVEGGPFSWAFSLDFDGGSSGLSLPDGYLPPTDEPITSQHYLDMNTGWVYSLDPATMRYVVSYKPPSLEDIPNVPDWVPDAVPPAKPVVKNVVSEEAKYEDGSSLIRLTAEVGYQPAPLDLTDLASYIVEATRFTLQGTQNPDWGKAQEVTHIAPDLDGSLSAFVVVQPVLATTTYWVRVCARDKAGNRSVWSEIVTHTTTRDEDAPGRPEDATCYPGVSGLGVRWSAVSASDLSYYEVQWREAGSAAAWGKAQVKGTVLVIGQLQNGVTYDVRVRSVDASNNTLHDTGTLDADGNKVYETRSADEDEVGWVIAGGERTAGVPGSALIWDEAMFNALFSGYISADMIAAGDLTVGGGAGVGTISIVDSNGNPYGTLGPDGFRIQDPANPSFVMEMTKQGIVIWDYTDQNNPQRIVTIGPNGIDAASITFGSQRGGHNMIPNSSFELGTLGVSAAQSLVWETAFDWEASRVGSDVNITTDTQVLRLTSVT
jgi:hypothetical protein